MSERAWERVAAKKLYAVDEWGRGFFDISDRGEVLVFPKREQTPDDPGISLMEIVSGLKDRGIAAPVLLRFPDILDARLKAMYSAFQNAMSAFGYQGSYRGVYPIKVNQQQQVIEEITSFGEDLGHGLEAGSKAELLAALTYLKNPGSLLICNGYKDQEFIDLALCGQKIGLYPMLVVETPREVSILIERSRAMGVRPHIGVRVKLTSKASGYWSDTGGDRSVFGLNTAQTMRVVDQLRSVGMLDCLELLHYHLGSQVPDIRDIRNSVLEACRTYAGLVKEGAGMKFLDLGGGLAGDYDGSKSSAVSSANYSLSEYCRDVVEVVQSVMDEHEIDHPVIVTEAGRATVAFYSVLLFNVLDVSKFDEDRCAELLPDDVEDLHTSTRNLNEVLKKLTPETIQESYNNAFYYRDELRELFKHGSISLRERSVAEALFWSIITQVAKICRTLEYVPEPLQELDASIADIYYGNFSVFQSLPDAWAIDQFFPIIPIHKHNEEPPRNAVISDITCDCDGRIDQFKIEQEITSTLRLHDWKPGDAYFLGAFLVGAYQETLGDLHNLLGDTNVVSIRLDDDGSYTLTSEIEGDSVSDVLSYVEYDPRAMIRTFREKAEAAVRSKLITSKERKSLISLFEVGMRGYTYHED